MRGRLHPRAGAALAAALAAGFLGGGQALAEEQPVPPYTMSDANAGTTPIEGHAVFDAFHGRDGVGRIVDSLIVSYHTDPRLSDIFHAADFERLSRLLKEQFCYILGGPCHYTGRDMRTAHADQGLQVRDFDALVEDLQAAMDKEHVPFWAQNRLLAKLAPMKRMVVTR
jgi:hemoglobin